MNTWNQYEQDKVNLSKPPPAQAQRQQKDEGANLNGCLRLLTIANARLPMKTAVGAAADASRAVGRFFTPRTIVPLAGFSPAQMPCAR